VGRRESEAAKIISPAKEQPRTAPLAFLAVQVSFSASYQSWKSMFSDTQLMANFAVLRMI
jgi:hypothetical protein